MGGRGSRGVSAGNGGGGGNSGPYEIPKFTAASLDKMPPAQLKKLYNQVAVNAQIEFSRQWGTTTISRSEAQQRVDSLLGATSTSAMKRFIKKHGKK